MKQSDPIKIDGIYYRLNHDNKTAEATHNNKDKYTGSIVIPQSICFDGELYTVITIGKSAFEDCSELTSVIIPNTVITINEYVFCRSGLSSVTIPDSVKIIESAAFHCCSELKSIIIPNSVTVIGIIAFSWCTGLKSIEIPNSVTNIGFGAFSGCSGLTSVTIPKSVVSIGYSAFTRCSAMTTITVEQDNRYYDSRNNCNAIIKSSTNELIAGCRNSVIPDSVVSIGKFAFSECSGESVVIPNSVTRISRFAFLFCVEMTTVTIPSSVVFIEDLAFEQCTGLVEIKCLAIEPPTCGRSDVFLEVEKRKCRLFVPKESIDLYKAAEGWKDFTHISAIEDMVEEE